MVIKLKWNLPIAILVVIGIPIPVTASIAVESCQNVGLTYRNALDVFRADSTNSHQAFKELLSMKREAEKLRNLCIKAINNEFKNALKAINLKYSSTAGSREEQLMLKTKKDNDIALATLRRDKLIRNLLSIPDLPQKPVNTKEKSRKP